MRRICMIFALLLTAGLAGEALADKLSNATFNTWCRKIKDALKKKDEKEAIETIGKLAEDDSERVAKFLFLLSSRYYTPEFLEAIKQALARISDHDGKRYIVSHAPTAKIGLQPVLAQVLGAYGSEDAFNVLLKYLESRKAGTVLEAAKVIARRRDSRAVDKLITALEKWQDKDKDVRAELRYALINCTGSHGDGLDRAEDWRTYWKKQKSSGASDRPAATANPKRPKFFGTTVSSMRFVFIIDISGSMRVVDPGLGSISSDTGTGTTPADEVEPERERVQGETRIKRTKAELVKAIKQLTDDVKFNIIAYNDKLHPWKPSLQEANAANKNLAIEYAKKLKASGLTFTDAALREAFKNKDADNFILLSDGAPTHEGGEPRVEWDGHRDSKEIIEKIHQEVAELNRLHNVRIDTIGFSTANMKFMRKLAEDNGGTCTALK